MLKLTGAGAAAGVLGVLSGGEGKAGEAEGLEINIAGYDYDRVHAIMDRQVGIDGADNFSEPFSLHIRACYTKKQWRGSNNES